MGLNSVCNVQNNSFNKPLFASSFFHVFFVVVWKTFNSYLHSFCLHSGVFRIYQTLYCCWENEIGIWYALTIYSRNISIRFVYIKFLVWFHRKIEIVTERERDSGGSVKKNVISNSNSIQLVTTSYCHTCNAYRISTILNASLPPRSAPVLSLSPSVLGPYQTCQLENNICALFRHRFLTCSTGSIQRISIIPSFSIWYVCVSVLQLLQAMKYFTQFELCSVVS